MTAARIDATIAALGAFVPTEDDASNVARLYEILEGFGSLAVRERAVRPMFELVERFPLADLGSPGPLVHELEAIEGYRSFLCESLHRRPTALTVWMVNRILNSSLTASDRALWLSELQAVLNAPEAPVSARQEAEHFLELQKGKTSAV